MVGQPLVVLGSMGQQREHPLLSKMRQQRGLLGRTLAQLKLPDEDGGQAWSEQRSSQARSAAYARVGPSGCRRRAVEAEPVACGLAVEPI